jgi:hypothetical protein
VLRFDRGDSARSIGGAAVAKATVALSVALTAALVTGVTGCTSKSSGGQSPSGSPSAAAGGSGSTSEAPDTIAQDATASLQGTATITLSGSSPVTVKAGRSQPVTLQLTPSGAATIDLSMRAGSSALFSLSGPARTGAPVGNDKVAILLADAGVLVDTNAGNPCTASYDVVSETKVSGTVRCETLSGSQKVPVTVRFTAS